jgi:hypothetical protein
VTDDLDKPEPAEYGLVMPFVVTTPNGPYDGAAFGAGWECGQIDRALKVIAVAGGDRATFTTGSDIRKQLELIGMRHGFPVMRDEAAFDEPEYANWRTVTFLTAEEPQP